MREELIAVMIALSMTMIAPAAAAEDVAGASGQCFDDDGSGGDAHLAVNGSGGVAMDGLTDASPDDPTPGAADAVVALVDMNGDPASGNGCTSQDSSQQDYVEAHAGGQQVCYNGSVNTDGGCPTR